MRSTIYPLILILFFLQSCSSSQFEKLETMNGVEMTYKYTGGNSYNVKFENDSVSYRFLTGSAPELWWGPFEYNYMQRENGEYFLSWYEHSYGDYITLLIANDKKTLLGSGIVVKKEKSIVHFQKAVIREFKPQKD